MVSSDDSTSWLGVIVSLVGSTFWLGVIVSLDGLALHSRHPRMLVSGGCGARCLYINKSKDFGWYCDFITIIVSAAASRKTNAGTQL
jgi:hypothetical protein